MIAAMFSERTYPTITLLITQSDARKLNITMINSKLYFVNKLNYL
jgi:hypothetical protein